MLTRKARERAEDDLIRRLEESEPAAVSPEFGAAASASGSIGRLFGIGKSWDWICSFPWRRTAGPLRMIGVIVTAYLFPTVYTYALKPALNMIGEFITTSAWPTVMSILAVTWEPYRELTPGKALGDAVRVAAKMALDSFPAEQDEVVEVSPEADEFFQGNPGLLAGPE